MKFRRIMTNAIRPMLVAVRHRNLLTGFVTREVRGRFAGNAAGMAWALMNPLATMLVYMFVFSVVLRISVTAEETGTDSFFIYFITGFVPWLIFSDSLNRATGTILDNASIVTKVIFPVELLPVSSVCSALFINFFGFVLLVIYLPFQGFFSLYWIVLVLLLPLQTLFMLGLGMLFSAACVYLRDVREMTGLILMIWFFSTPIIYPMSMVPEHIQSIIRLNPMYMFTELYRDALLVHSLDAGLLMSAAAVSLISYAGGSLFFARVKNGFGDVL